MPHYADGTEAKTGDLVFGKSHSGVKPVSGYVIGITPGSDTCNMRIATMRPTAGPSGHHYGVSMCFGDGSSPEGYHAFANVELCNCSDCHLLYRDSEEPRIPRAPQAAEMADATS